MKRTMLTILAGTTLVALLAAALSSANTGHATRGACKSPWSTNPLTSPEGTQLLVSYSGGERPADDGDGTGNSGGYGVQSPGNRNSAAIILASDDEGDGGGNGGGYGGV